MTTAPLPDWQQKALDDMSDRLAEWLPDHKLHLVLIRAPFADRLGNEITDPAFEEQLEQEFEADRLAGIERDRLRAIEQQDGAKALRSFVATKRRNRRSTQPSIPLP
jgi:hypothetical protein